MYKKLAMMIASLSALVAGQGHAAQYCQAYDGFYVGAFGGANWTQSSQSIYSEMNRHTGYVGGASLGYRFISPFRVEGEIAYRRNHINSSHVDAGIGAEVWSYMGNLIVDLNRGGAINPYAGIGVGYAHLNGSCHLSETAFKIKNTGVAYQAIAGMSVPVNPGMELGVEYRLFQAREHLRDHSLGIAVRQSF